MSLAHFHKKNHVPLLQLILFNLRKYNITTRRPGYCAVSSLPLVNVLMIRAGSFLLNHLRLYFGPQTIQRKKKLNDPMMQQQEYIPLESCMIDLVEKFQLSIAIPYVSAAHIVDMHPQKRSLKITNEKGHSKI